MSDVPPSSTGPHGGQEWLAGFQCAPDAVAPAVRFRSTWLASSLLEVRERELFPRYLELLPVQHHEDVAGAVAGAWLPVDVAIAHYASLEQLGLSESDQMAIGKGVCKRVHASILSLVLRLAREAGVTPWTILPKLPAVWERIWEGGAVSIHKIAHKEAKIVIAGWPVAGFTYCRIATQGVIEGMIELFCRRAFVRYVPTATTATYITYNVSWV